MPQPNDQVVGRMRLDRNDGGSNALPSSKASGTAGTELKVDLCVIGAGSGGLSGGNDVAVSFTPVPEPAGLLGSVAAAAGLFAARRRRKAA